MHQTHSKDKQQTRYCTKQAEALIAYLTALAVFLMLERHQAHTLLLLFYKGCATC